AVPLGVLRPVDLAGLADAELQAVDPRRLLDVLGVDERQLLGHQAAHQEADRADKGQLHSLRHCYPHFWVLVRRTAHAPAVLTNKGRRLARLTLTESLRFAKGERGNGPVTPRRAPRASAPAPDPASRCRWCRSAAR